MREILFRGYNVESKKWYQGMLGKFDGKYYIDDGKGTKAYVDEESIGQYTTFKDKYGEKIFEGDCITYLFSGEDVAEIYFVGYSDGAFSLFEDEEKEDVADMIATFEPNMHCEVVENIYERKMRLKNI